MGHASRRKWEARLDRLSILQEKSKTMHPLKVLRGSSVALFMGAGLAVIFAFFWTGLIFIFIAAIVLAIDFYLEPWTRKWRLLAIAVPISIVALVSIWAWQSAPLDISMMRHLGNYEDGQIIGGIQWHKEYSEFKISFTNPTDNNYEDFDMIIKTDLLVAKKGWIENPLNCSFRLHQYPALIDLRAKSKDEKGNTTDQAMLPLVDNGPYRVHCDKLLSRDHIQIVFALVSGFKENNKGVDITRVESVFGPKKLPEWAAISGSYRMNFRPYTISRREQLTGD